MAERLLRRRLEERLVDRADRLPTKNPPSHAQLSRLRGIIQAELTKPTPDTQCVAEFLTSVRERQVAVRQFEHARIEDQHLSDWLDRTHKL
jgi:hypothetical protein